MHNWSADFNAQRYDFFLVCTNFSDFFRQKYLLSTIA